MRKAEITVHLFQETRHIMPDRPAKNLHQYEFCVCCGGITSYQVDTPVWMRKYYIEGCGQLCRCCYFETKNVIKGILIPIAVILSLLIAVGGFYWTKLDKLQFSDGKVESGGTVDDSDDDVLEEESRMADAISGLKEQEVISASGDVNENKDYINILLIGTDERTEYFNDNARGDSCMILTLGKKDGSVKLASLERGMGVPILEGQYEGEYDWLTHTFRYGGADLMMREVRECFKVDVDRYIRVNFATFVQGIESVGGVDISLTEAEAAYINKFNKGGITCVAGQNHLDGRAALEYARCRKIDSDWQRVKRQRNVIQAAVNSTKDLSISELNDLMNQVFPLVQTNLSKLEITELLMLAPKCRGASIQQITIPIKDSYGGMTGLGGRSLFSVDFDTNAQALREFMYGENSDS